MKCKKCEKEFVPTKGLLNFCSLKCRNSRSFSEETKLKKSISGKLVWKNDIERRENQSRLASSFQPSVELKEKISKSINKFWKSEAGSRIKKEISRKKTGHFVSAETRKKLSVAAKKRNFGGHTSKLKLYYKCKDDTIVYLQSSFEIIVAKSLDENNISWNRPNPFIWNDSKNIEHKYYPDFYLQDFDIYLDPKNPYLQKRDKEKIELVQEQNNIKILVLNKKELSWDSIKNKIG